VKTRIPYQATRPSPYRSNVSVSELSESPPRRQIHDDSLAHGGVEGAGRIHLGALLRVGVDDLDACSRRVVHVSESTLSTAQHLPRRIGENDVVAAPSKPECLMAGTTADVDDPSRRRGQMHVQLPRGGCAVRAVDRSGQMLGSSGVVRR
jgi:hypothetical protein